MFDTTRINASRAIGTGLCFALLICAPAVWAHDRDGDDLRATPVGCGDNLSEPGLYELEADLVCNASIRITSSHVQFDLKGHGITCSDPEVWQFPPEAAATPAEDLNIWIKGISVNFVDVDVPQETIRGVVIRNGTISGCAEGILLSNVEKSTIANMQLTDNGLSTDCCWPRGLEMVESNRNLVTRNRMNGNGQGMALFSSEGNWISHNETSGNVSDGMVLIQSSSNLLRRNTADGNEWGLFVEDSPNNTIVGNELSGNFAEGLILVGGSDGNAIVGNEVIDSGAFGILLLGIPQFGVPVPADNFLWFNTALGSGAIDLAEGNVLDYFGEEGGPFGVPTEVCTNTWIRNTFDSELGPEHCIR